MLSLMLLTFLTFVSFEAECIDLRNGYIRKVCSLDGILVRSFVEMAMIFDF